MSTWLTIEHGVERARAWFEKWRDVLALIFVVVTFGLLWHNQRQIHSTQQSQLAQQVQITQGRRDSSGLICGAINEERRVLRGLIVASASAPTTRQTEALLRQLGLPARKTRIANARGLAAKSLPEMSCGELQRLITKSVK